MSNQETVHRPPDRSVWIGAGANGYVPGRPMRTGWLGNPVRAGEECLVCGATHTEAWESRQPCYRRYLERRIERERSFRWGLGGIGRGNGTLVPEDAEHREDLTSTMEELAETCERGPTIMRGELWEVLEGDVDPGGDEVKLVLLPGSADVASGELHMPGMNETVDRRFPRLREKIGRRVLQERDENGWYGLMVSPQWPERTIGVLQTTVRAHRPEGGRLVLWSMGRLGRWMALEAEKGSHVRVHLRMCSETFPGVGRDVLWDYFCSMPTSLHLWWPTQRDQNDQRDPQEEQRESRGRARSPRHRKATP